ncbi:protein big brother isoform X1 [Hydra vulgaris]|uniref:protein big brother isoform X1 n=1 Tax=Hydra vulgaris TaxID=6087 RepID=UPI001F5ECA02|nr:protein big brother isoform X1 [Hydra vulgaris]
MARIVPDQKTKFETDELFRKLSKKSEIRYTGYRDRGHEERVVRFQTECFEGRCSVAFISSGTNLLLFLGPQSKEKKSMIPSKEFMDFDKELGKVHLKSCFVMNGVSVKFRGCIDLQKLDGTGYLEYDDYNAKIEDTILRDAVNQSIIRQQNFEERQLRIKQELMDTESIFQGTPCHGAVFG